VIFYAYLGLMGLAFALSLFNLRKGDIRLSGLAFSYLGIVAGFHWVGMSWLHLQKTPEFPLFVAGAQGVIAFVAYETGCRAAKIIQPFAWAAILINCLTWAMGFYPSVFYFYSMNFIQCAQIASLLFASSIWHGIATQLIEITRKIKNTKGMSYEQAG